MLTDAQLKSLPPLPAPKAARKLFDKGGVKGLYFLQQPRACGWRFRYYRDGKERLLSLGPHPQVDLAEARQKAQALRKLLDAGVDPSEHRKAFVAARIEARDMTFGLVGQEWLRTQDDKAPRTRKKEAWLFSLVRTLHARPVSELKTPELVRVLRAIEGTGDRRETAHRAAQFSARVLRFAVQSGYIESNPAADLRGALKPIIRESHAAITDPAEFGRLLKWINSYDLIADGSANVTAALRVAPYVFTRPGELRQAEWGEFDLDKAEWLIPGAKMKMRRPHLVPLATQVVALLRTQQLLTGTGRYVFPGRSNVHRPLSDAALGVALKKLFFASTQHTAHGFRSTASTLLNGELGFDSSLVEIQLAHARADKVAAIYDRSQRIPERRAMMQRYADYLDELRG